MEQDSQDSLKKVKYSKFKNMSNNENVSVGCGCLPLILTILVLWALWFGLPTSWGTLDIDIFPPAITLTK